MVAALGVVAGDQRAPMVDLRDEIDRDALTVPLAGSKIVEREHRRHVVTALTRQRFGRDRVLWALACFYFVLWYRETDFVGLLDEIAALLKS